MRTKYKDVVHNTCRFSSCNTLERTERDTLLLCEYLLFVLMFQVQEKPCLNGFLVKRESLALE